MKDRFKFRAWTDNEVYIYDVLPVTPQVFYTHEGGAIKEEHWIEADYEQCTGLKDKNGKLIYEGDIVQIKYYSCRENPVLKNVSVRWDNQAAKFTADSWFLCVYKDIQDSFEVIGNINENGDLLD